MGNRAPPSWCLLDKIYLFFFVNGITPYFYGGFPALTKLHKWYILSYRKNFTEKSQVAAAIGGFAGRSVV